MKQPAPKAQPKAEITLGRRGDAAEREADAAADAVLRGEAASAARAPAPGTPMKEDAQAQVARAVSAPGRSLRSEERAGLEPGFGRDLSAIRLHEGAGAHAAARAVGARAFAMGRDIVFGTGAYQPGSAKGQRLLAHEITHALQQGTAGRVVQRAPPEGEAEEETLSADQVITRVMDGKAGEVTAEDLRMIEDVALRRIIEAAKVQRGINLRKAEAAHYDNAKKTFEREAHHDFVVANMGLKTLIRRERAKQASYFKALSPKIRAEVDGEALCFYDSVSPYIPYYLEAFLEGKEAATRPRDLYRAGYITWSGIQALSSDSTKMDEATLLGMFVNTPKDVARQIHKLGDQPKRIAAIVNDHQFEQARGLPQAKSMLEKIGTGASEGQNMEKIVDYLEEMIQDKDSAYACQVVRDSFWPGTSATPKEKKRQAAVVKAAEEHAAASLDLLDDELVAEHKIKRLGLEYD